MIPKLGDDPTAPFPPASEALPEPDGLLAWGGDLAPERLLRAYRRGIFPWYSEGDPLLWWCPALRCVLPTDEAYVSRRLARLLRQRKFRVTADLAFLSVVRGCIETRRSTWITPAMQRAYETMHQLGYGHSVEVWREDELAGGIYGLSLGHVFFGESMFSAERDASKVGLVLLCGVLHAWGFPLLDCQVPNPHLERMGARLLPREKFLEDLARHLDHEDVTGPWTSRFEATLPSVLKRF